MNDDELQKHWNNHSLQVIGCPLIYFFVVGASVLCGEGWRFSGVLALGVSVGAYAVLRKNK